MGSLKKETKILIFAGIGLVVLALITLLLMFLDQKEAEKQAEIEAEQTTDGTEEETVDLTLTAFTSDEISSVTVKNGDGTYTIDVTPTEGDSTYEIKSISTAPQDSAAMKKAVDYLAGLKGKQLVEDNASDLEKYGLANPVSEVTVTLSDGTTDTLYVGNESPVTNTTYVRKKDSNMVCIINTYYIAAMLKSQYSYITTQVMPAYDDTVPSIDKITITKQGEEPIIIEAMPVISEDEIVKGFNTHRFTQPVKVELDATNGETLIYGMYGLTASEAVWYGMEESDYALTGLDNPTLVVDMQVVRQHYTLTLGLPVVDEVINEDGTTSSTIKGYYGTFSELPDVLYIFSPSSIPWLNIDYEAVMSRLFLLPAIYSVSNVYVEAGDYDLDMAIEGDATAHVFSVNGTPTPNEDNFKLLYQYLISAMADNLYTGGPIADGAEPVARISYKFRDSAYTDDVVEFYKTDDRKLIICLNGEPLYTCKENYVTRLVQNIESYYNNGSIIISW